MTTMSSKHAFLGLCLALGSAAPPPPPQFNLTACPAFREVQAPKVAPEFSMRRLAGTYYELALHDYTQFPTCPKPSCIRSVKRLVPGVVSPSGGAQIVDSFTLSCFGRPSRVQYFFNETKNPGALLGFVRDPPLWWKGLGFASVYNDTVVDFGPVHSATGQYEWVIEFQCRGKPGKGVTFTGINFYSRVQAPPQAAVDGMLQAARDRGLGYFMDLNVGTRLVPQTNCSF